MRSRRLVPIAVCALSLSTACAFFGKEVYDGRKRNTFSMRHYSDAKMKGGRPGALHPAVIEYVFGAADSPWPTYYDTYLASGDANGDMRELRGDAEAIAGADGVATGHHYARARGRALAGALNRGLALKTGKYAGVDIRCCTTVNRDTDQRERGVVSAQFMSNADAKVVLLKWADMRTARVLTWDLSRLPDAFRPEANLDYATVAAAIRPMHPPQPRN